MPELPSYIKPQDRIILFDGVCVLCTGWAKFLLKYDRQQQFKLASVQSPEGQDLLRYAQLPTQVYETLVLIDQGEVYLRSSAVIRILKVLGMPWSLLGVFEFIPRKLRDIIYHQIAINRYRLFGRRPSCYLPKQGDLARFVKAPDSGQNNV